MAQIKECGTESEKILAELEKENDKK